MGDQKVDIEFGVKDGGLNQAWIDAVKKLEEYQDKLKEIKHTSHEAADAGEKFTEQIKSGARDAITEVLGLKISVEAVVETFKAALEKQEELREKRALAASESVTNIADFVNASQGTGLANDQLAAVGGGLERHAATLAMMPADALKVGSALIGQGFNPLRANEAVSVTAAYAGAMGVNPDVGVAISLANEAAINDPTHSAESLSQTAAAMYGVTRSGGLRGDQVSQFGTVNSLLKQSNMSAEQRFAMESVATSSLGGDAGAASSLLKALFEKVRAPSDETRNALSSMNLSPEQVDAIGESGIDVLNVLGGAYDKMKPEERLTALSGIVGFRQSQQLESLLLRRGEIPAAQSQIAASSEGFSDAAERSLNTPAALRRRRDSQRTFKSSRAGDIESMEADEDFEDVMNASDEYELIKTFKRWEYKAESIGIGGNADARRQRGSRIAQSLIPGFTTATEAVEGLGVSMPGAYSGRIGNQVREVSAGELLPVLEKIERNTSDKGVVIEDDRASAARARSLPQDPPMSGLNH